jgi:hypothetical protein
MVRDVRELGALLGEASGAVTDGFPRMLLAFAKVPKIARLDIGSLEIPLEDPN